MMALIVFLAFDLGEFLQGIWKEVDLWDIITVFFLLGEAITRATKTTVDDSIFKLLQKIFDKIIPNRSKAGGVFKATSVHEEKKRK